MQPSPREKSTVFETASLRAKDAEGSSWTWEPRVSWIDFVFAVLAMAGYALWLYKFGYRGFLAEDDLYSVLVGLLDGARNGTYLASVNHYGKSYSFGYIAALYQFASPHTLTDRQLLMSLMNSIGFWAACAGCLFFWLLAWLLHGLRVATVAVTLFALSPMMLELGTSGHQILPAFALFMAGAVCLLIPVGGIRYILLGALGGLLLLAALVTRAEVVLAFPFLALARPNLRSFPAFLRSAALHTVVPALAYITFLLLKHRYVDALPGASYSLNSFVDTFYSFKQVPLGLFIILMGWGIVTGIVALIAACWIAHSIFAAPAASEQKRNELHSALGPFALAIPALAFWIANPAPARHFILCLAGASILIGLLITKWLPARPLQVYAVVVCIIVANQALASFAGPVILKHAPTTQVVSPEHPRDLPSGIIIGSSWGYHRAYEGELSRTMNFAESLRGTCDTKTLALTGHIAEVLSTLYESNTPWKLERGKFHKFSYRTASDEHRTVMVLSEYRGWPDDAVAVSLTDPAFSDFQLVRDPNVTSIYDRAAIPAGRTAHLGCAP